MLTVSQCLTWRLCRRLEIGEVHCSPNSPTDPTNVYQGMPDMPLPAQSYSIYSTFRPRLGPHLPIHNDHIHHGRDTNQLTCTVHEVFARGQEIDQVVEPHALPTAPGESRSLKSLKVQTDQIGWMNFAPESHVRMARIIQLERQLTDLGNLWKPVETWMIKCVK